MEEYDILIRNAVLVDGTGAPAWRGSIAVKGDRIASVGKVPQAESKMIINASGLTVSPGFIDAHTHADKMLPIFPMANNYVMQGIATTIGGNCGITIAPILEWWPPNMFCFQDLIFELRPFMHQSDELLPADEVKAKIKEVYGVDITWGHFKDFLKWLEKTKISVNYVPLVGHNTIRAEVMWPDWKRKPKDKELIKMKEHISEAMETGAFGFSTGLDYIPGVYANIEEVIELAKVVKEFGGMYVTHYRRPLYDRISGLLDAISVGKEAGVQVQISHITTAYKILPYPQPKELEEAAVELTLRVIDGALADGLNVAFDIIPKTFGGEVKYLASLLSSWIHVVDSRQRLAKALKMTEFREVVKSASVADRWSSLQSDKYRVVESRARNCVGKTLKELAGEKRKSGLEAIFDVIVEDPDTKIESLDRYLPCMLETFLKHPLCMLGLDVFVYDEKWSMKPPFDQTSTGYLKPGSFEFGGMLMYLRRFVRERKILTLEEAIRRITSLPANTFRIRDRGVLKPGAYADIVIFDSDQISDGDKSIYPKGIKYVLVNGEIVVKNGKHTCVRSGKVLKFRRE